MDKHFSINVMGKVQGVFFRASAREKAEELGVKGFVRNEPDGSVYIEAESDEKTLQQFTDWCRLGPPRARVEELHVKEGPVQGFEVFETRRS
jgi:acylphosphatase